MQRFVDPRAEPGAELQSYDLSTVLDSEVTIGLLANGFPDSVRFLDCVEEALRAALPGISTQRFNKGNASIIAGDQLLDGITKECRAVVTAYGH